MISIERPRINSQGGAKSEQYHASSAARGMYVKPDPAHHAKRECNSDDDIVIVEVDGESEPLNCDSMLDFLGPLTSYKKWS